MGFLFADGTLSPSAEVIGIARSARSYLGIWFVDATAVWTLFVRVTDGFDVEASSLQVVVVTLISEELSVTQGTERGGFGKLTSWEGSFGLGEIGTVSSFARRAPFAEAGVMSHIVVIESFVAFVAEVGFVEKSTKGIAPVIVIIFFDETNDLVGGNGSCVDDHVRGVNGHDLELVPRQSGLKLSKFWETARSFGNACGSVKFLGRSFLDWVSILEIFIVSVSGISVSVRQGFHGDDGSRATQGVLVLDGDARPFHDASNGSTNRFVPFTVPSAGTRGTNEGGLHGEGIVGSELFVGVQFGGDGL